MKCIVLAAGKGTRLQSEKFNAPKVLRQANGRSLISYVLENTDFIPKEDTVVVVGYKKEMVIEQLDPAYKVAVQEEQKGTGHAVQMTAPYFEGYDGTVLIVYGDMPLFTRETYQNLIKHHEETGAKCTILTSVVEDKLAYGRILRDENDNILGVVEDKDCTPEQKAIKELNVGVYAFDAKTLFENLALLKNNNAQGEYYLTDIPMILLEKGEKVEGFKIYDAKQIYGVNTPEELEHCERILRGEE